MYVAYFLQFISQNAKKNVFVQSKYLETRLPMTQQTVSIQVWEALAFIVSKFFKYYFYQIILSDY